GDAVDPDPRPAAVASLPLAQRLERIDAVGAGVLAEAEEDHPRCSVRHERIIAARRALITRSWSSVSRPAWNGSESRRRLASSETGSIPSRKPKRSRMYDWRWSEGRYRLVAVASRSSVAIARLPWVLAARG